VFLVVQGDHELAGVLDQHLWPGVAPA
jgi:hypothetical protein